MYTKKEIMILIVSILFHLTMLVRCSKRKKDHFAPTFFRQKNLNGEPINAYLHRVNNITFKNEILEDKKSASLKVWPEVTENGGRITVLWSNVPDPDHSDIIAYYCPFNDKSSHPLDYVSVGMSETWNQGYGHIFLTVYNMRVQCGFKYYSKDQLVAISNKVFFNNGGPLSPLQGHLALTNDATQMRVMWNSAKSSSGVVVKYGVTKNLELSERKYSANTYDAHSMCAHPANSTGFWDPGYIYDVLLTYLKPNTRYYYSFGTDEFMSKIANFTTALPRGDKTSFKFIYYGDMGVADFPEGVTTAKLVRQELEANEIRFVFHNGDISYAKGYAYIWEQWFNLIEPYATLSPYMISIGNHEQDHTFGHAHDPSKQPNFRPSWFNGARASGGECGVPMFYRFHMPDNGLGIWWYSFDYGMIHMVVISTEHDFRPGTPQYEWLENDLRHVDRTKTPFVMLGGHRAMYCSSYADVEYLIGLHMQEALEDLLYKYKVDVALWAHLHVYERTCKIYKNKCAPDGITHLIVGSAGRHRDDDIWYDRDWSLFRIADYGYGRFHVVNETHVHFEFVQNRIDKIIDSVWIVRDS